ncbi:hypothetical protein Forpe1208_v010791 [Fusarium oxysporum f. sp. rapae]|uniref:C-type lectin domain-containing protein n=1 Tax=Fusarium oxysporum f. sp. rapae TaxID=485398 RepID=A0A8J5TQB6_FUSOX|nr:hypothetical protein Forpe1208_v010791 [Fusarium oxysporum f. sp. rapae]
MLLSTFNVFVFVFGLLPLVSGKTWHRCRCEKYDGGEYSTNWELTYNVCVAEYPHDAEYRSVNQECHATNGYLITKSEFENACEKYANNGYYPVTDTGRNLQATKKKWNLVYDDAYYRTHCD